MAQTIRNPRNTHGNPPKLGGQHRASVGISTLDSETPAEWRERIRRMHRELGEPEPENLERFEKWTPIPSTPVPMAMRPVDG